MSGLDDGCCVRCHVPTHLEDREEPDHGLCWECASDRVTELGTEVAALRRGRDAARAEIAKLKQEIEQLRAKAELLDQWAKDPNEYGAQMQRQRDVMRTEVERLTKVVRAGMGMATRFRCEARAALNEREEGAR